MKLNRGMPPYPRLGQALKDGGLPPKKIKNRHFEKVIACMVLKLTVYVKNVISFFL